MPSLDKKRKTWTGKVRLKGFPQKERRGFQTKTAAKEWERLTKIELKNQESQDLLFSQTADLWLVACQKRNKTHTCYSKALIINNVLAFWRHDPYLKDIDTLKIEEYLNTLPGKTANRHKRELITFFLFAIKRGLISDNPASVIDRFKEKPFLRYVPPQEDIQAVINIAVQPEKNILIFAYHTLARAGEIRGVKWEDVDFERKTITLWTSKTRMGNRESDTLDMTDTLYNMLHEMHKTRINDHVFNHEDLPLKKWWHK